MSGKEKLKTDVYLAVLNQLKLNLKMRHSGYSTIYKKLNFLINIENESIGADGITREAEKLQKCYETDIDETTFSQECIHFKTYIQNAKEKNSLIKVCSLFFKTKIWKNHFQM